MSVHSRIDKTLDELLDMPSVIRYLGKNITFPKLAVAQARISGRAEGKVEGLAEGLAEGMEQGSLEMAGLVRERLIPNLEERANESLTQLGEKFISTLGTSGVKGVLVRDKDTGLPVEIHPTIKEMFPDDDEPLYYEEEDIEKKSGERLKQPEIIWSQDMDKSVDPKMRQKIWRRRHKRFPRYETTGELMSTKFNDILLSKLDNFPMDKILRDMRSKKSFHIHDWGITNREIVTNLKALPAPALP